MAQAWKAGPAGRLHALLADADITNVAAAEVLGISHTSIHRYRKGAVVPDAETLAALVEMAGGSADYVLGLMTEERARKLAALYDAAQAVAADRSAPEVRRGRRKRGHGAPPRA